MLFKGTNGLQGTGGGRGAGGCGLAEERNSNSLLLLYLLMKGFIFPTGKMNGPGAVVRGQMGVSGAMHSG